MANLSLIIYDKPREWIKEFRAKDTSWEEIEFGRKKDYAGLQQFLEFQSDCNDWPAMSISDWKQLILSEKNAEENIKRVDIISGIAHIHDERQDNAITIPHDKATS